MNIINEVIQPLRLRSGDKVTILSPSGYVDNNYILGAKSVFENWGLDVEIAPHANSKNGRFSGSLLQRLEDLQRAMDDSTTKMIFCSRGGYGAVHLLEHLNFEQINLNPKWLVGYSDITALHLAFLQNGLQSLHAPMARHLTDKPKDVSTDLLQETLFGRIPKYILSSHILNKTGITKGCLIGGNLAVLSALIGTPYMSLPQNPILFIEDIGEAAYKIDRMLWQLKLSGILSKLSGLIIGQFTNCEEDPLMTKTIYESFADIMSEYNVPVVFNFPVGHVDYNYTLIHGAFVSLSVNKEIVTIEF